MKTVSLVPLVSLVALLSALPLRAETIEGSLNIAGTERTWQLFVPADYRPANKHALVFDFHGTGGTPQNQGRNSSFTKLAAAKGFLVVNPAGKYVRSANGGKTWNVDLDENGVDDVRFIRELIAHLEQRYSIDPNRIYATGFSGGARISSRLACDLSDVIAAVGPVGGIRFPDKCTPIRAVPVMAIHAEDDEVNHFIHRPDSPPYWPVGVAEATSDWANQNGCDPAPRERRLSANAVTLEYQNCRASGDVVLVKLKQGGHTWPGSPATQGKPAAEYLATEQLWEFFERHPR